jgi:head-tail adaptor
MIRAGRLRTEVTILDPPNAETPQDVDGQPTGAYATFAVVMGEVTDGPAAAEFADDQYKTVRQVAVRLRYLAGVSEKQRLTFDGRTVEVTGVRSDQKKTETVIDGVEIVA